MANTSNGNIEIEARFLVCGNSWRDKGKAVHIFQGYLATAENRPIRIRIVNDSAILTIKGQAKGLTRKEFEFTLNDMQKAQKVIDEFCNHPVEKIRYEIRHGKFLWEVDEYLGRNQGLVLAEVEFKREAGYQEMLNFGKPPWVGKEITRDAWQYTNARLSVRPFALWSADEKKEMLSHAAANAPGCLK